MSYQENADFVATLEANKVQQEKLKAAQSRAVSDQGISEASSFETDLSGGVSNQGNANGFRATFKDELRRVARFVNDQQVGLELSAKALFLRADTLANEPIRSVQESFATVHDIKRSTGKIVDDCLALQDFYTSSRKTLMEIASMAHENVACSSLVDEVLPKASLNSSLVCVISDIYNALRQAEENILNQGNSGGPSVWQAPSSFQRATTKYWVKDENLTRLMMVCAKEAPLLVYGMKGPLTSTKSSDLKVSDGDKLWDSLATRITSIYFDSDDMSLYKERIARAEGAQLLRARWYGPTMPTGDKIIFVELKTHHEKWVGNKSVKERASVQAKDMVTFLEPVRWLREDAQQMVIRAKPDMKPEDLEKATDLLFRMHNLVVKHKLNACVRTRYDRAAFQSSKSNDLRLTLDRNVTVVNEREQQPSSGQWCLTDSEAQTARASVVPYNVFEVKLASNDPMPTGLAHAMNDSTIEFAPKFSKFLTGAAAYNAVSTLPYWASHPDFRSFFELDKRWASEPSSAHAGDYHLMGLPNDMVANVLAKGVVIAPKYPARVEPKTFFANERTFVQWISASIMLLQVSSFMMYSGLYDTTAAIISLAALVLVVYSTGLYFKRLQLLKARQAYGYFNKLNPIFLTSVVGFAIFLVWADSIKGGDIFGSSGSGRRLLGPLLSGRFLHEEYEKCPQEIIGTNLLIKENPSSLAVDFKRHSFLMTSDESVYFQPMNSDGSDPSKADRLIRIGQSHLQGLAVVGNQVFAVSDGPELTEMIGMAWWGTHDGKERLRVVGRWTLEDSRSQVDGFSFVPSTDSTPVGSFYVNTNSSVRAYSVPATSEYQEPDQSARPMRLRSLNMKVLIQRMMVEGNGSSDRLSTMITFEGITYILSPKKNALEAWNLTDGTLYSEIVLPATGEENTMMKWTGFALERRAATSTETPNVRGGEMLGNISSALFLHLMTDEATSGGQVWTFPVLEDIETPSGLFSVPDCQIAATSMN